MVKVSAKYTTITVNSIIGKDILFVTGFDHINEKEWLVIPKKTTIDCDGVRLEYNCHPGTKYTVKIVEEWVNHPSGFGGKVKIVSIFKP